jgi:predicted nucleic acid-binding protein
MIYLLDSNIVIYLTKPENASVGNFLSRKSIAVSQVSFIEVLGFHKITDQDKIELEEFFSATRVFAISDDVADKAVELRQIKKMSLGDSIVAATALVEKCTLATNNVEDFKWIKSLKIINPLDRKN